MIFSIPTLYTFRGDDYGSIRRYDTRDPNNNERAILIGQHAGPVLALAVSPDGRYLASSGTDSILRVWNISTGKALHSIKGHLGPINVCRTDFSFSGNMTCLVSPYILVSSLSLFLSLSLLFFSFLSFFLSFFHSFFLLFFHSFYVYPPFFVEFRMFGYISSSGTLKCPCRRWPGARGRCHSLPQETAVRRMLPSGYGTLIKAARSQKLILAPR